MRARMDNRFGLASTLRYALAAVVHATDWRLPFGRGTGKPVQPVHSVKTGVLDSGKVNSEGRHVLSTTARSVPRPRRPPAQGG